MSEIKEHELVKRVFSNSNGKQLLEFWEQTYGQRMSYSAKNTPEHTAYREGERSFPLSIRFLLEFVEPEQPK